ncbi:MAG: hypothetical protein HFJ19_04725 [Clostridia bacterium]|nr:hypothetical protein [Clostridia bacterium]
MFWNKKKSGIVNVKMVITEEKILSNIGKIQKLIDPASKKTIIQLDDDTYFKDLIESIKMYLVEYPNKKTFPESVYSAAYGLVEYATNQFEENTKQIEELIRQRETNIMASTNLKEILNNVEENGQDLEKYIQKSEGQFGEDIVTALNIVGKSVSKDTDEYNAAVRLIKARINNLETNLHIEIDMERIEDRSKALSYIGLEVAEALKEIPAPEITTNATQNVQEVKEEIAVNQNIQAVGVTGQTEQDAQYIEETQVEAKKSFWQKFKQSKIGKVMTAVFRIRIVMVDSALPEGRGE